MSSDDNEPKVIVLVIGVSSSESEAGIKLSSLSYSSTKAPPPESSILLSDRYNSDLQQEFFATLVYGYNLLVDRKELWNKISNLCHLRDPWIIFGDFNAMFNFQDRVGGKKISTKEIEDAQKWLSCGQVDELKCLGVHYSWSNKHEAGDKIFSKLDRVFTNNTWLISFPKIEACFKWECISDHSFCVIKSNDVETVGFKPFRFYNHWLYYHGFKEAVWRSWTNSLNQASLVGIMQRLVRVKQTLRRFSRKTMGDVIAEFK
ncbi:hypothetical protein CsatB_023065 [Cannabis sativa]